MMIRRLPVLIPLILLLACRSLSADPPDAREVEFFEAKVRPILVDHCVACHGADKQKAGLRLDAPEPMRAGGDSGPAIVPGKPEESLLVEAVGYEGVTQMPPKGPLAADQVQALSEWVRRGAVMPEAMNLPSPSAADRPPADSPEARAFWAFQPVSDPPLPDVSAPSWPRTGIDRFVLAKLDAEGLTPAPEGDRRVLIRRLSFDLTGLPPAPEEVQLFVSDPAPDAYERLVERLLASPAYGERWARHWLDIARYGEDQAHSFQPRLYPNGFRYRDWVVNAFNTDLPYDRFLVEQIAADLVDEPGKLQRLPALGFFACGPVYYGDRKGFDQIDDRIDTLARGVLGLTVACARCHDHKYDPIPTSDYYALAGVFASTKYEEAPIVPREVVEAYNRGQKAIETQETRIRDDREDATRRLARVKACSIADHVLAAWTWENRRAGDPKASVEQVARERELDADELRRWVEYLAKRSGNRPALAAWARFRKEHPPASVLNDDPEVGPQAAEQAQAIELAALDLLEQIEGPLTYKDKKKKKQKREKDEALLADLLGKDGLLLSTGPKIDVEPQLPPGDRDRLARERKELERIKKESPEKYPTAHALKDGKPRDLKILLRGNPENEGEVASRHFLSVLGGDSLQTGSGRLELARAIASPENPLTARVFVNRVWQHHFGHGLVNTPSNFGLLGERPSHPELLDYLARRFVESGWSVKSLQRLIVLSAAYRQSSRFNPRAAEVDPENRLVWRMSRKRLEIEPWRDAMLSVSGRLDDAIGGPPGSLDDPNFERRTLYGKVSRHDLSPVLRLFDFPEPNITSAKRTRTSVPLQGLYVLNDEFVIGCARSLARRLNEQAPDDEKRIERAYQLLFARQPRPEERAIGLDYLRAEDPEKPGDLSRWERYAQALLGSNEFLYVD